MQLRLPKHVVVAQHGAGHRFWQEEQTRRLLAIVDHVGVECAVPANFLPFPVSLVVGFEHPGRHDNEHDEDEPPGDGHRDDSGFEPDPLVDRGVALLAVFASVPVEIVVVGKIA